MGFINEQVLYTDNNNILQSTDYFITLKEIIRPGFSLG